MKFSGWEGPKISPRVFGTKTVPASLKIRNFDFSQPSRFQRSAIFTILNFTPTRPQTRYFSEFGAPKTCILGVQFQKKRSNPMFFRVWGRFAFKKRIFSIVFAVFFWSFSTRKYPFSSGEICFHSKTKVSSLKMDKKCKIFAFRVFFRFHNFTKKLASAPRKCPPWRKNDEASASSFPSSLFSFSERTKNIISSSPRKFFKSRHARFLLSLEEGRGRVGLLFLV